MNYILPSDVDVIVRESRRAQVSGVTREEATSSSDVHQPHADCNTDTHRHLVVSGMNYNLLSPRGNSETLKVVYILLLSI